MTQQEEHTYYDPCGCVQRHDSENIMMRTINGLHSFFVSATTVPQSNLHRSLIHTPVSGCCHLKLCKSHWGQLRVMGLAQGHNERLGWRGIWTANLQSSDNLLYLLSHSRTISLRQSTAAQFCDIKMIHDHQEKVCLFIGLFIMDPHSSAATTIFFLGVRSHMLNIQSGQQSRLPSGFSSLCIFWTLCRKEQWSTNLTALSSGQHLTFCSDWL